MTINSYAEACQTRPDNSHGHPTGYGDWRLAVEILLPSEPQSLWGVAEWDEDNWTFLQWYDITDYCRGMEWTRGADEFDGRPRVGVAEITLDNTSRIFSPLNASSSFQNLVNNNGSIFGAIINNYFGPGTLVRIVAHSPTGYGPDVTTEADEWVPQFTGVVESWDDSYDALGVESYTTLTVIETISQLARVNENALSSAVGNDDTPYERMVRLADAADWKFGYLNKIDGYPTSTTGVAWVQDPGNWSASYLLQSTDMADNRLAELYLTADSTYTVIRSDRSGALVIYSERFSGGYNADLQRGPLWFFDVHDGGDSSYNPASDYDVLYVPDSVRVENNSDPIINYVQLARAGGSEQTAEDAVSITRYGKSTFSRNDLINKSDNLTLWLANNKVYYRKNKTLRLASLELDNLVDTKATGAMISLDVGVIISTVWGKGADGGTVNFNDPYVDTMEHRVTPLNGSELHWTCRYTVGSQGSVTYTDLA